MYLKSCTKISELKIQEEQQLFSKWHQANLGPSPELLSAGGTRIPQASCVIDMQHSTFGKYRALILGLSAVMGTGSAVLLLVVSKPRQGGRANRMRGGSGQEGEGSSLRLYIYPLNQAS